MKLDAKQKVLIAIYSEYQKDIPKMEENVTAGKLGLDQDVFNIAVDKLQNEELIKDATIEYSVSGKVFLRITLVKMTRVGIDYVESKFEIEKAQSGLEKATIIMKKAAEFGYEQLQNIAAKAIAEMVKGQ